MSMQGHIKAAATLHPAEMTMSPFDGDDYSTKSHACASQTSVLHDFHLGSTMAASHSGLQLPGHFSPSNK